MIFQTILVKLELYIMSIESVVSVLLNRAFDERDEKAVNRLMGQWLAYDVKISRRLKNTEIKFYSEKAKSQLVEGIKQFYPNENLVTH